jgi:chromosomal replication initiator protein
LPLRAATTAPGVPPLSRPLLRSSGGPFRRPQVRRDPASAPFAASARTRSLTPAHTPQPALVWEQLREHLCRVVDPLAVELWVDPLEPVELDGACFVLAAAPGLRDWIEQRFGSLLDDAARALLGPGARVALVAAGPGAQGAPRAHRRGRRPPDPDPDLTAEADDRLPDGHADTLSPKLTFEQFVIGDCNRFAHAAALAVAELPGQAYNPLFIYGPPGVGKTHLLHSIGNYVRAFGAGLTVRATTTERFTSEFVAALHTGQVDRFKGRFRRADVLLIDDVQFLESKARTEEEFFHTFNALHEAGSQLVLTSDRLPRDLDALEDRLRERFEAGLVTDVAPPDRAVRIAVLRKRVHHDGVDLRDPQALDVIADRVTDNVRALEGALIRVVAFHSLTGRPLDAELAAEVLDGLYPASRGRRPIPPTVERIQELTCEAFGITRDELLSTTRTARVAWPRQVAMYLAREHTDESLPAIGRRFGGRNHTTVLHACRKAGARLAADREAYEAVRALTARLHAAS